MLRISLCRIEGNPPFHHMYTVQIGCVIKHHVCSFTTILILCSSITQCKWHIWPPKSTSGHSIACNDPSLSLWFVNLTNSKIHSSWRWPTNTCNTISKSRDSGVSSTPLSSVPKPHGPATLPTETCSCWLSRRWLYLQPTQNGRWKEVEDTETCTIQGSWCLLKICTVSFRRECSFWAQVPR